MVLKVQGGPSLPVALEAPVETRCDATLSLDTLRSSSWSSEQPLKVSVSIKKKKAATGSKIWGHVDWSLISLSQGEDSLEEVAVCLSGICNKNPPASLKSTKNNLKNDLNSVRTDEKFSFFNKGEKKIHSTWQKWKMWSFTKMSVLKLHHWLMGKSVSPQWSCSKCSIGPLASASQTQTAAKRPSGSQASI